MRPSRRRAAASTCSSVSTDTRTSRPPHFLLAQDAEPHLELDLELAHLAVLDQPPHLALLAAIVLGGCSVLSIDLQPRIRPLEEDTVEGKGTAKILLLELSGVF